MDIFENKKKKTVSQTRAVAGSFEDMVNARKRELPKIKEAIQEVYKDYTGEMTIVIRMNEDENGDITGRNIFIGGVAGFEASIKMLSVLDKAKEQLMKEITKGMIDNPGALKGMLNELLDDINEQRGK